jgi:methionyl aminopeptidase
MAARRTIHLRSNSELELMREAGRIVAVTLGRLREAVRPGVSTADLDRIAEKTTREFNAIPSFLGYHGFPASVCCSINSEIVHGIPRADRILRSGDIVSLDFGAIWKGYHGDSAITVGVGDVSAEAQRLMRVTEESLALGIAAARSRGYLTDIGAAVQAHAEANGFSVVRKYVGHGIGQAMHEAPEVPNYGPAGFGTRLRSGMVLAIEPMVNVGTGDTIERPDGWTVVTADGGLSAHFEHTVAITDDGPRILTLP